VDKVLCSVATRGRYHTTLPLTLNAIINQTKKVDKLVIFDDNDEPQDMRKELVYSYFFQMLTIKGIAWEWVYAGKQGQHYIHQMANTMGFDWVWRVDDDAIPEPNVLQNLFNYTHKNVGAVGGAILTPPFPVNSDNEKPTGKIELINREPNIQWFFIDKVKEVEHLHCSFLYRAGVHDYHLGLSRVAHREETLFTYGLFKKGYKILAVPNANTWHLKNPNGGIRSESNQILYGQDETVFNNLVNYSDKKIVILTGGMGDHIVFTHVLPEIKNAEIFTCFPDIVPGKSIVEAHQLFGNLDTWNVYIKMHQWKWKGSLEDAYRKMYL
jgi:GT2 family glycosyltransferase